MKSADTLYLDQRNQPLLSQKEASARMQNFE